MPDYVVTHMPTITVTNVCASPLVKLSPAVPVDGWLKIAGNLYQPNMVVPFVTDIIFDYTKLTLTTPACLALSTNSKLVAYLDGLYYGDSAQVIYDSTKNPERREYIINEKILALSHGTLSTDPSFDFLTQTKLTLKLYAVYNTLASVLAAYRDPTMQINVDYNVFRIIMTT